MSDGSHVTRHVRQSRYLGMDSRLEIPPSYLILKEDIYTRAKNGTTGLIDFGGPGNAGGVSGADPAAVIQEAINAGHRIFIKNAVYALGSLVLRSNLTLELEDPATALICDTNVDRFLDARNCHHVLIVGGKVDGNGKAKTVIDFTQTVPDVTHSRVAAPAIICGARDTADSCLININGNSGFQWDEPWLDGRVGAIGAVDSAHYGIIMDSCAGQNTLYLGDINNFFKKACIRLGGGALQVFGGALEGGLSGGANIEVTSTSSGPILIVRGTWFESDADNILIREGAYAPGVIDVEPILMACGGAGHANIKSATTVNHLQHLRVRGGVLTALAGGECISCDALTAVLDKGAWGANVDLTKLTHYALFNAAGWGNLFRDRIETDGNIVVRATGSSLAGLTSTSEVIINNNTVLQWKQALGALRNILWMNNLDKMQFHMDYGMLEDPENVNVVTVTGLGKAWHIKVGGADYYIPLYTGYT